MKGKSRERLLIFTTIICLSALGLDKAVVTPLMGLWEARAQEMEQLEKSLSKGQLLINREREIRRRWREMQRDSLPESVSQAENQVLKSFDQWINKSEINLVSLKPQWKTFEDEEYKTLECRAIAQGGIEEVARFLYELERDDLSIKVENMELTSRDEQGQSLMLEIIVSGVQFEADKEEG